MSPGQDPLTGRPTYGVDHSVTATSTATPPVCGDTTRTRKARKPSNSTGRYPAEWAFKTLQTSREFFDRPRKLAISQISLPADPTLTAQTSVVRAAHLGHNGPKAADLQIDARERPLAADNSRLSEETRIPLHESPGKSDDVESQGRRNDWSPL